MKAGARIADRYELVAPLARGGMGEVWRARHEVSGRHLALKLLPASFDDPSAAARFEREVSAPARVGHPGLVEVLDAGQDGDRWFIAMELLEGEPLRAHLAEPQALDRVAQALEPLAALHDADLVHRDIKPENLFVTRGSRVKLLDFGLAKTMDADGVMTSTRSGRGTPGYLAPEQALAPADIGPATDVWAMGVILYEILAGRHPFEAETGEGMVMRACTEPHRPLAELGVARPLSELVDRCLAKEPKRRPPDAHQLAIALAEARDPPGFSRWPLAASALALMALSGVVGWWAGRREGNETTPASTTTIVSSDVDGRLEPQPPPVTWDRGALTSAAPPPPAEATPRRIVEGDGWRFSLPAGWYAIPAEPPHVVRRFAAPELIDGYRPNVAMVTEPFGGTFYEYGARVVNRAYHAGKVTPHSRQELVIDGVRGELIEATFAKAVPAYAMAATLLVHDGMGLMLTCSGPRDGFSKIRKTCQGIVASLRVESSSR
ncbi:MAG: serine/threonine-protein kinase [Polyangiaceae bacterium]